MSTAAIVAGSAALLGGVASGVGSAVAGSDASSAATNAAGLQESQFQQTQQNQAPFIQAGQQAVGTIASDEQNGTGFATPFDFQADPGYQFNLQQGENAINSSSAAQGGVLNGGTLKALAQYTSGLADTTYNSAYSRYLAGSQNSYNQLAGLASLGEGATATTGAQGATAAANAGNLVNQAGQDTAAGVVGIGSGINSGLSGIANAGDTYAILNQLQRQQSQSSYNLNSTNSPNTGYD